MIVNVVCSLLLTGSGNSCATVGISFRCSADVLIHSTHQWRYVCILILAGCIFALCYLCTLLIQPMAMLIIPFWIVVKLQTCKEFFKLTQTNDNKN